MINRQALLADLRRLLGALEVDLRQRVDEDPASAVMLQQEYDAARAAKRTGAALEEWRADLATQVAVGWVLSCVFVRFLEDNGLVAPARLSGPVHAAGPGGGLQRARDEREAYFRSRPTDSDRDYLRALFADLAGLPGARDLFGPHNPALAYPNWLSGDAAGRLIEFFRTVDPGTGELAHDFTDPEWDTRFLGDLYQDLSEAARDKYALLQTPVFVEEFILLRTLEPAILEFGLAVVLLIDPACGSGHFLLGAFRRLLEHWRRQCPALNDRERVNRALAAVHGVDLNPYAVAIARFRLLLAAMRETGVTRLAEAPAFRFNLACGDSLLHGAPDVQQITFGYDPLSSHVYKSEDLAELRRILTPGRYHAVVANPPYIVARDPVLNAAYRERYPQVCHMKYSLAVPFLQRILSLAVAGNGATRALGKPAEASTTNGLPTSDLRPPAAACGDAAFQGAGFTGQITANSFMKREFGKKLIESYLPSVDLTHVIDTAGAYIPGHGTPTVILFARNRRPVAPAVRAVMGIKGEPATPEDPAQGLVWSAILERVDQPGTQSDFVSVADTPREQFQKHPWSIGGGGAAELKEAIEAAAAGSLGEASSSIGFASFTGTDEVFVAPSAAPLRQRILASFVRPFVFGEIVRDWGLDLADAALVPYDADFAPVGLESCRPFADWMWPYRTTVSGVLSFGGKTRADEGGPWWTWYRWVASKYRTPLSIVFGEVATHNHFVLDRGGKVFNRTAPVIKLPAGATEDDHLGLLGLLNSSTACFWLKQVCFPKGGDHVGQEGARVRKTMWDERFAFNATNLEDFPLPSGRPLALARELDRLAQELAALRPAAVLEAWVRSDAFRRFPGAEERAEALTTSPVAATPLRARLDQARAAYAATLARMIARQEELDWECYGLYGLAPDSGKDEGGKLKAEGRDLRAGAPPELHLGERAFEVVLARKLAAGEEQTTWFERHGSTPITELPASWPAEYRAVVERRIALIGEDRNLGLMERPEYKRRWNLDPWDEQQQRALRDGLLDRLEAFFDLDGRMNPEHAVTAAPELRTPHLFSAARLADLARAEARFMQVAEVYTGRVDFDVARLVAEVVAAESVPLLPTLRYKPSGLDKRRAWERTWDLQRLEDAVEALFEGMCGGSAPTPPPAGRGPSGPPGAGRGDGGPTGLGEQNPSPMPGPASPRPVAGLGAEGVGTADASHPSHSPHPSHSSHPSLAPAAEAAVGRLLAEAQAYLAEARQQNVAPDNPAVRRRLAELTRKAQRAATGDIPVPPKYGSADFAGGDFWRLRGKLDVPKERWVSFPHCEGADGSLVIAWAGYDHLQLARAIAEHYELAKQNEGRTLLPLLAGLAELIPWLQQWHNDHNPVYNARLGDYFAEYLEGEARAQGLTLDQLRAWTPPPKAKGRGRRRRDEGEATLPNLGVTDA